VEQVDADFTVFVAERGPALIRIAYALTGDQRSAEDLTFGRL
jgi:DNA-directed RNA polymerase specialized sigma24 family protein